MTHPSLTPFRHVCLLALGALLAACAGTPQSDARSSRLDMPPLSLEETPPQAARPGACHLVLWTRNEPSRRILVAWSTPQEAVVQVRGQVLMLPLSASSGATILGHAERQVWSSRQGEVVAEVRFELLPGSSDTSAIRSAVVSFTDTEGETVVTPAIGLASCGVPSPAPPAP